MRFSLRASNRRGRLAAAYPACMRMLPRRRARRRGGGGRGTPAQAERAAAAAAAAASQKRVCDRCECQLCPTCSKPANLWTSPLGQAIETVTTRTEPRFTFAYNPYDDDMARMRKTMILEPMLTHAWHEATSKCCNQTGGLVIDVGGNFGWYTLYSLALGCRVAVFEPVPAYQEIMKLGLSLNPGFAEHTTLYGNVVYDRAGNYTLRVPRPTRLGRKKKLGMTGMDGSSGILKADWRAESYNVVSGSVRVDDIVGPDTPVCMLKADVEGYEPQVLQTARRLLASRRVPALQLELTRTSRATRRARRGRRLRTSPIWATTLSRSTTASSTLRRRGWVRGRPRRPSRALTDTEQRHAIGDPARAWRGTDQGAEPALRRDGASLSKGLCLLLDQPTSPCSAATATRLAAAAASLAAAAPPGPTSPAADVKKSSVVGSSCVYVRSFPEVLLGAYDTSSLSVLRGLNISWNAARAVPSHAPHAQKLHDLIMCHIQIVTGAGAAPEAFGFFVLVVLRGFRPRPMLCPSPSPDSPAAAARLAGSMGTERITSKTTSSIATAASALLQPAWTTRTTSRGSCQSA